MIDDDDAFLGSEALLSPALAAELAALDEFDEACASAFDIDATEAGELKF